MLFQSETLYLVVDLEMSIRDPLTAIRGDRLKSCFFGPLIINKICLTKEEGPTPVLPLNPHLLLFKYVSNYLEF